MRIQIVLDEPNPIDIPIMRFDQLFHEQRIIDRSASRPDLDKAPASQRFKGDKNTTGPLPLIFVILTFDPARVHRDRRDNLTNELTGPFIKTHDWSKRIVR